MLRGRAYHVGGSPPGGRIDGSVVVGVDGYRFAVLSEFIGLTVSPLWWERGLIAREQDPSSFRKAVGVQKSLVCSS